MGRVKLLGFRVTARVRRPSSWLGREIEATSSGTIRSSRLVVVAFVGGKGTPYVCMKADFLGGIIPASSHTFREGKGSRGAKVEVAGTTWK